MCIGGGDGRSPVRRDLVTGLLEEALAALSELGLELTPVPPPALQARARTLRDVLAERG